MKKLILLILMLLTIIGCKCNKNKKIKEVILKSITPYEELYGEKNNLPYVLGENTLIYQAKHGYQSMNKQGFNYWYYGTYNQGFQELRLSDNNVWGNDNLYIDNIIMR